MKSRYKIFGILISTLLIATAALAVDENNILRLTLTNNTIDTIQFDHVIISNSGNEFSVTPIVIKPSESAVITGNKTLQNDLYSQLLFRAASGEAAILTILDQEQIHFGQPIFKIGGDNYTSTLISKTRNKNTGPRFLMYTEAHIEMTPKQSD